MNIILIVSDTLRYDCVGFHTRDPIGWDIAQRPRTPNIDRFAAQATVFDNAHTGSFPTLPMRTDMLTGKLTFPFRGWSALPAEETVLAEELTNTGYVSMLICDTPHLINDGHRFDRGYSAWHWNRGQEGDRAITDDIPVALTCDPSKLRLADRHLNCHLKWRTVHWQSEADTFAAKTMSDAIRWLERNHTHDQFFLHIDAFDPHEPWDPPQHYRDMYDPGYDGEVVDHPAYANADYLSAAELRHCRALYAGEVTLVDTWLGRLFDTVERLGLYENTAVVFLSDHGHYVGDHGRVGKSGNDERGPWPMYDEINHIAMMARIPGGVARRSDYMAEPVDIMPTLMELADVPLSEPVHGQSLVPILRGGALPQRPITVTSSGLTADPKQTITSVISDGVWRLQYRGSAYPSELYNLREDPAEERDVLSGHRGEAERLHHEYVLLLNRVGTPEDKVALRSELPE